LENCREVRVIQPRTPAVSRDRWDACGPLILVACVGSAGAAAAADFSCVAAFTRYCSTGSTCDYARFPESLKVQSFELTQYPDGMFLRYTYPVPTNVPLINPIDRSDVLYQVTQWERAGLDQQVILYVPKAKGERTYFVMRWPPVEETVGFCDP
jgi:hypothetical protein